METIYVIHATSIDYINLIYKPLLELEKELNCRFILPHRGVFQHSEEIIKRSNSVLVFGDTLSFGMGIEYAWANQYRVPIYVATTCLNQSRSLNAIRYQEIYSQSHHELFQKIQETFSH